MISETEWFAQKKFIFDQNILHNLLANHCIIRYILWIPTSPSKMGGGKNFRKPSAVGMGGHKTLISRRRVTFLGKGSKDLPGKWKLHNLDYILITLTLCKIYAYSENISSLSLWVCKFTIYTHVLNEFSEKKTCWAGRFYSSIIFVRLYVFCNLT